MFRFLGIGTTNSTPAESSRTPLVLPTQQPLNSQPLIAADQSNQNSIPTPNRGTLQIRHNEPVPPTAAQLDLAESISNGWELLMECKEANREDQLRILSHELSSASSIPEESEKTLASLLIACFKNEALKSIAEDCLRKTIPKLSEKGLIGLCELFCSDFFESLQSEGLKVVIESLPVLNGMTQDEALFQKTSNVIDSILAIFFAKLSSTTIGTVLQFIQELVSKYHPVLSRISHLKAIQMYKDYLCSGIVLGKGSYAKVFLCFHKKTAEKYAMKLMKDRSDMNSKSMLYTKSEIEIQTDLSHPNIVRLHESFKSSGNLCLILEYCSGGNLAALLAERGPMTEDKVKSIMRDLKNAFEYLQSKNIAHRDMKPANILLAPTGENMTAKLADFTYARSLSIDAVTNTYCGSPLYMAPEILNKAPYSNKADLWSLGIIMFELLTGKHPFEMKDILRGVNLDVPEDPRISAKARELLQGLLQADPTARISWPEFFMHSFMQEPKKQNLGSTISPLSSSLDHLKQRAELAERKMIEFQQKKQEAEMKLLETEKKFRDVETALQQRISELESLQLNYLNEIRAFEERIREKEKAIEEAKVNQNMAEAVQLAQAELNKKIQALQNTEAELIGVKKEIEMYQTKLAKDTMACEKIKDQLERLQQEHAALQDEKAGVRAELDSVKNELVQTKETLTKEIADLRAANEKKVGSQQERIDRLQTQHDETVSLLDQTKEKLAKLVEENETNKKQLSAANSRIEEQTLAYGRLETITNAKIAELEEKLASSILANKNMASEIERLKQELDNKSISLKESSAMLDKHKQTLEQSTKSISDANAELISKTKLLEEQTQLAERNAKRNAELEELLRARDKIIAELNAALQDATAKHKQQISSLEADVKERNSVIALITTAKTGLETRCEELSAKLAGKEASETKLAKENEQLHKQVASLQQMLLEGETNQRSERVRVDDLLQKLSSVSKERDTLKIDLQSTKEQMKRVVDEARKTTDKLADTVKELQSVQIELMTLREQRQDADIRAQTIQCLLDSNEHEINTTRDRLEDALERVRELEQTKKEMTAEIETYKKRLGELQIALDEKTKMYIQMESERNDLLVYKMLYDETPRTGNVVPFDL